MYRLTKQFTFCASHALDHLPVGHKCARLHGHNYTVELVIESEDLDDRGFCRVDFGELAPFKDFLDRELDHRHLNDWMKRPTAERLAWYLFGVATTQLGLPVAAVRVSETQGTWAEYRP